MSDSADNGQGEGDNQLTNLRLFACDGCRLRKVKCDKNIPCSSCVAAKVPCRVTKRTPEKKQRVLLSRRYDEGMVSVNRKLEDLSVVLQSLVEKTNKQSEEKPVSSFKHHQIPAGAISTGSHEHHEPEAPYEGDSSFAVHYRQVIRSLGGALESSASSPASAGGVVNQDQSKVQKLLQDISASQSPAQATDKATPTNQPFTQYPDLRRLSLPPMDTVLKLLRIAKTSAMQGYFEFQVMPVAEFTSLCQNVYFPAEEHSIYVWIIVNSGLYYLLYDYNGTLPQQLGMHRSEVAAITRLLCNNIEAAVNNLSLCIEPSMEACHALALGAFIAIEDSKSGTAWKLITAAARMALDLGLHRLEPGNIEPESRRKRFLFWNIYSLDKGLSLNFGRTPTIHEYDITIDRPPLDDFIGVWGLYYLGNLELSILEGDIYQLLFSVSAQRQPQNVRTDRAITLVSRIRKLKVTLQEAISTDDVGMAELVSYAVLSNEVVIHCLLTLVLRVIPQSTESGHPLLYGEDCVIAARTALQTLSQASKVMKEREPDSWLIYMNWTLFFIPFVPFIVVFGSAVAQHNRADLQLLHDVVSILETAKERSNTSSRLYDACCKFTEIADVLFSQDFTQNQAVRPQGNEVPNDLMMQGGPQQGLDVPLLPDFPMSQEDWDLMLNQADLGLGMQSAREMTAYFEQFMNTGVDGQVRM